MDFRVPKKAYIIFSEFVARLVYLYSSNGYAVKPCPEKKHSRRVYVSDIQSLFEYAKEMVDTMYEDLIARENSDGSIEDGDYLRRMK